jgi:hypothetical protein
MVRHGAPRQGRQSDFSEGEERLMAHTDPTGQNTDTYAAHNTLMGTFMGRSRKIYNITSCKRTTATAV